MKNKESEEILDKQGKIAADLFVEEITNIDGLRVVQRATKINNLWSVVFDVYLPNGDGHIEFTAIQTGWSGDAFVKNSI